MVGKLGTETASKDLFGHCHWRRSTETGHAEWAHAEFTISPRFLGVETKEENPNNFGVGGMDEHV